MIVWVAAGAQRRAKKHGDKITAAKPLKLGLAFIDSEDFARKQDPEQLSHA